MFSFKLVSENKHSETKKCLNSCLTYWLFGSWCTWSRSHILLYVMLLASKGESTELFIYLMLYSESCMLSNCRWYSDVRKLLKWDTNVRSASLTNESRAMQMLEVFSKTSRLGILEKREMNKWYSRELDSTPCLVAFVFLNLSIDCAYFHAQVDPNWLFEMINITQMAKFNVGIWRLWQILSIASAYWDRSLLPSIPDDAYTTSIDRYWIAICKIII